MNSSTSIRFVAESTLGRLSRWLRLAGFDTLYDRHRPDVRRLAVMGKKPNCIILTRTKSVYDKLGGAGALFIADNAPLKQVQHVMKQLGIQRSHLKPLSRCITCNQPIVFLSKTDARGRVPDYIYQAHAQFRYCPRCNRTYWPGTHTSQALKLIDRWFEH